MSKQRKITLGEAEIPTHWYNIAADMPNAPLPPLDPATKEPIGPEALAPLFPMALIEQEVSTTRYIEIPERIREAYALWRPTPMYRAHNLEKLIGGPARIYYQYEGASPAGRTYDRDRSGLQEARYGGCRLQGNAIARPAGGFGSGRTRA